MPPLKDKWIRRFVINETTRHKQGFTIYKVSSIIFLKSSPDTASKVFVWKRYNDFKKLHTALKALHGTLQISEPFPPFAKPKFFGRFEAEVVDERRECAIKFLEFIARHSSLFTSDVFVKFFETSLADDSSVDCSQSISSETSEDDKIPDNSEQSSPKEKIVRSSSIGIIQNAMNENQPRKLTEIKHCDKTSECLSLNNNNNNNNNSNNVGSKISEDMSWQRFLSVEKLVEDGKNESLQFTKKSTTMLRTGSDFADSAQDSGQYILIAAAHMSAGFRHEATAEYEEAFMQYKLGIATLRDGVQKDFDLIRRATIVDKIIKYSERADRLYNRHLNCNISMISKPVSELQYYKVLRVMGSVMLVKDLHRENTRIIKTVEKPAGIQEDISKYILRGKVPHMVQLHACVQTETTVFLILQYASGGKLWDFLKDNYAVPSRKRTSRKRSNTRSVSCEAIIHLNTSRRATTSRESVAQSPNIQEPKVSSFLQSNQRLENPENSSQADDDSSLKKLEEEFGANSIYNIDLPTTQLLEKAQQLLKSVDATIKRSNSIASRLNDSARGVRETQLKMVEQSVEDSENAAGTCNLSELSLSGSCGDLSSESDKIIENRIGNSTIIGQLKSFDELHSRITEKKERKESLCHDEDSGIEMEQELWRVPETILKSWIAQILLALEALHQQNVVVADLRPENILVNEENNILLSYVVPRQRHVLSKYQKPYTAPELCMFSAVITASNAADVWSFGVLLYELFTGIPFQSRHPGPFHSHSIISIPSELSDSAKSLLTKILKFDPNERPTIPEIKQLPFFERIDWLGLLNA